MNPEVVTEIRQLLVESRFDEALRLLNSLSPKDRSEQHEWEWLASSVHLHRCDYERSRVHGVRALRLSPRSGPQRVAARLGVACAMFRMGGSEIAERLVRRGLAELEPLPGNEELRARLLNELGRIHRRRGALGEAIALYERSLELVPRSPGYAVARCIHLAQALIYRGERDRAADLLDELKEAGTGRPDAEFAAIFHLTRYLHAVQLGRFEICARALQEARESPGSWTLRVQWFHRAYRAELQSALGDPKAAIPALQGLLAELQVEEPKGDVICTVARVLATAHYRAGQFDEALAMARLASQSGERNDAVEWVRGLRLEGQCLGALGRIDEAASAFSRAQSALDATDIPPERQLLEQARRSLLKPEPLDGGNGWAPLRHRPIRSRLNGLVLARDGRTFFTRDQELIALIHSVASSTLPVLIEGETGTGKELVAHLLHELGGLGDKPFVVVDCTALPESLAEAELFGTRRGAYTGATADRSGLFEAADGGTVFLDELTEMPVPVQAKLLRVLQEGTFRRVGDVESRRTRVRIVTATNRNVDDQVRVGALRNDLFFRINGHRITLTPLRDRPEEIGWLAERFASREGFAGVTAAAVQRLRTYDWPGNSRQLEMFVRLAFTRSAPGDWLEVRHVDAFLEGAMASKPAPSKDGHGLREARARFDREVLSKVLCRFEGGVAWHLPPQSTTGAALRQEPIIRPCMS